jgi:hypothetical protein
VGGGEGGMGRSKSTRKASKGINEEEMEENVRPFRSLGADDLIVTDEIIFRRRVGIRVRVRARKIDTCCAFSPQFFFFTFSTPFCTLDFSRRYFCTETKQKTGAHFRVHSRFKIVCQA